MESREKGFSLIELMVAMVVTLIISGAVFQLVTAGQSAFKKEPAAADRQQNIRMAVDILGQDLFQAGYGMPSFAQAFTNNLNAVGPMGSGGEKADELEIFRASECPPLTVCPLNSDPSKSIVTMEKFSACYDMPAIVLMGNDSEWDLRWAKAPGKGETAKNCGDSGNDDNGRHGHAVFPPGQAPILNPTDSFTSWQNPPTYMMVGMAIRYRINIDADGVPNFERSTAGGQNDIDGNSTWQIIARGIEDLQVRYTAANGIVTDNAGVVDRTGLDYNTIIQSVTVTLSARSEVQNVTGVMRATVGPTALRGTLTSVGSPRAALNVLGTPLVSRSPGWVGPSPWN